VKNEPVSMIMFMAEDPEPTPAPGPNPGKKPKRPRPEPGKPGSPKPQATKESKSMMPPPSGRGKPVEPGPKGNAVYRIDPDGFVREIFRQQVLVLSLLAHDNVLLVGTGSDGTVYQIDPGAEETVALAKVDPKQVLSLLAAKDGRVFMGLANVGSVAAMSRGFATEGTYTSAVLDATQVSRFGKLHLQGSLPEGTTLKIATRSSNVESPEDKGWSNWTESSAAAQYQQIDSPSARFLQYRLTFGSKDGKVTPVIEEVDAAYQVPNLPPEVKTIHITAGGKNSPPPEPGNNDSPAKLGRGSHTITWEASDPNNDPLVYNLFYRLGSRGKWILLKEKLKETTFEWDTRSVGDGQYSVKVVASDDAANTRGTGKSDTRVSEPISIDNTPPIVGDLKWQKAAGGVKIDTKVVDRSSTVANLEYSVDSHDDWQAVLPSDNIYDQPEEAASFTVNLSPGSHQVTIRATDAHGNQAFESLNVQVEAAASR
jgi:hypothetical protein